MGGVQKRYVTAIKLNLIRETKDKNLRYLQGENASEAELTCSFQVIVLLESAYEYIEGNHMYDD